MAKQESYRIGPALRDKLRDVISTVDALSLSMRGPSSSRAYQDIRVGGPFRICTYTGAWSKTTSKTVTLKHAIETPNTIVATNLFAELAAPTGGIGNCAVAREGTAWFLISAEC